MNLLQSWSCSKEDLFQEGLIRSITLPLKHSTAFLLQTILTHSVKQITSSIFLSLVELRKVHQQKQDGHSDTWLHSAPPWDPDSHPCHPPPPWVLAGSPWKVNQNNPWDVEAWDQNPSENSQYNFIQLIIFYTKLISIFRISVVVFLGY